jgi:hypothetical protein
LSFSDKSFLEKIQRKILEMVKNFDEKKLKEKIFTSKIFFASTRAKNFVCRSKQKSSGLKFSSKFFHQFFLKKEKTKRKKTRRAFRRPGRRTQAPSATGLPHLPAGAAPPLRRHAAPPPATRLPTAAPRCPTAAAGPALAAGIRRAGSERKEEREERKGRKEKRKVEGGAGEESTVRLKSYG